MTFIDTVRGYLKTDHRAAGTWATFTIWLSVLFAFTYSQTFVSKASSVAYGTPSVGASGIAPAAALFRYYDEVGLLAAKVTALLLVLLMVGVYKARYRFAALAVSVATATAIALGALQNIARNAVSDEMGVHLPGDVTGIATLANLSGMLVVDACLIAVAAAWATTCLKLARRRRGGGLQAPKV